MNAAVETFVTEEMQLRYKRAVRDQQRAMARNSAVQPRVMAAYRRVMEAHPLLFRIAADPMDTRICWRIIRELVAFRKAARTPQGRALISQSYVDTAAILIFSELARLKAARTQSLQLAAE